MLTLFHLLPLFLSGIFPKLVPDIPYVVGGETPPAIGGFSEQEVGISSIDRCMMINTIFIRLYETC